MKDLKIYANLRKIGVLQMESKLYQMNYQSCPKYNIIAFLYLKIVWNMSMQIHHLRER